MSEAALLGEVVEPRKVRGCVVAAKQVVHRLRIWRFGVQGEMKLTRPLLVALSVNKCFILSADRRVSGVSLVALWRFAVVLVTKVRVCVGVRFTRRVCGPFVRIAIYKLFESE